MISGYLITLLLIGEHERTGGIDLRAFWLRRARRLLPALFVMMGLLTAFAAIFKRHELGQLRGDVLAGTGYVSNWYQLWVGQGYTATGEWAPLRHLWSLAVEEQFYLVWPLVMAGLLGLGRRRLPEISRWLLLTALVGGRRRGPALLPRSRPHRSVGVVDDRRSSVRQDRHAVPVDDHARQRPAHRRGVRDALAAVGGDAWPAAHEGAPARRRRHRRPGRARLHGVVVAPRDARRGRSLAVPRRVHRRRSRHHHGDRCRHASRVARRAPPRHPDARLRRHPLLRPVPVPLADLRDHPRRRRQPHVGHRVRHGDGAHRGHHRGVVPFRRDPDPPSAGRRHPRSPARRHEPRDPPPGGHRRRRRRGARRVRRREPGDRTAAPERFRRVAGRRRTGGHRHRRRPHHAGDGCADGAVRRASPRPPRLPAPSPRPPRPPPP